MIKTITTLGWPTIQNQINNLPPAKQELFNKIKTEYESETAKEKPDHEKIASLMAQANELLTPHLNTNPNLNLTEIKNDTTANRHHRQPPSEKTGK